MMSAHKAEVIWLDEIAEALRNCVEGLGYYKIMRSNWTMQGRMKFYPHDQMNTLVEESMRAFNYTIGVVSYRLMVLNKDEDDDMKKLSKLNILQGGIEPRFIPSLSQETKTQIEGSFKITQDKQL